MNDNPSIVFHDAYICEIAKLPMALVATPLAEEYQKDPSVSVCTRYGSQKPVIVYLDQKGGLYREPVNKWRNTENGHEGYGVLELLADISHRPMMGADLKQMCSELANLAGVGAEILDNEIDYREYVAPQNTISYRRKPGFTVEELNVLGCTVYLNKDGIICYGFDCKTPNDEPYFIPDHIKKEFRCYPLMDVTLPAVKRDGKMVSERIISTPFNPLFVCFADVEEKAGCIVRPGMPNFKNVVFSKSEDFTITKVARWLGGDAVFTQSLYQKSLNKTQSRYTGFRAALQDLKRHEAYQHLKDIWHVKENGKQELVTVDIPDNELKADNIIFCHSMQDAIATYFHLNALKAAYPNSADLKDKTYHVCFNFGNVSFSALQYSKAYGFAHRIYTFFPNDAASVREARMIGKKYREICRAALPDSFADVSGHCSRSRIYQHKVNTIRDFFLVYKMDKEQAYGNDYDLNKLFLKSIVAALSSSPLKHNAKKDKNGETKDDFWTVNAATLWEFMASEGYCRVVTDESSTDKVGRFYHLDFPFFDELDRNSMVSATRQCLRDYARTIARPDSNDYEKICDTIAKAREISDKTIDGLPRVDMDYKASYNEKLDHFYYRNCALRITPTEITAVPYDKLTFFVNRSEVLPWDFQMPFLGGNVPFTIDENPEYTKRKQAIEAKKEAKDDDGKPVYSSKEIDKDELELDEWGKIHRWRFDFRGKPHDTWWPPLLVLRCFANEFWREEEEKKSFGEGLNEEETDIVNAHLANLLFCLARPLYRFHQNRSYSAPYLMENKIQQGQRAQGGSGKSTFVDTFMGCAGYVLDVDGKNISPSKDLSFEFSDFVPRHHRVVHIEDLKERQSLDPFYNYITGKFRFQKKFVDVVALDKSESPGIVLSSNFAPVDLSDSTTGRYPLCGFSDRFCRPNIFKNQRARSPADIMKDFSSSPERLSQSSRNQIAYICAVGVQFIMKYDAIAPVPTAQPLERAEENKYGKSFMAWQSDFFARMEEKKMFGIPLDLVTCFSDYMAYYVDTSEKKEKSYSKGNFFNKLSQYCNDHDMIVNPKQVCLKEDGKMSGNMKSGKFRLRTWCKEDYFYGKEWENDTSISPKSIRVLKVSEEVFFIFKKNDPDMPANYAELLARHKEFCKLPDPDPILDEEGKPFELTDDEKERWKNYTDFKQGKPRSSGFSGVEPIGGRSFSAKEVKPLSPEEVKKSEENLPF